MRPPSRRPMSSALPGACPPTKTRKLAQDLGWTRRRSEWSKWATSRSRGRRIRGRCRVNWRTNLEQMKENSTSLYLLFPSQRNVIESLFDGLRFFFPTNWSISSHCLFDYTDHVGRLKFEIIFVLEISNLERSIQLGG